MGPTEVLPGTQYWSGNFEGTETWHADDHLDRDFTADASKADDLAYRDERLATSLRALPFEHVERKRLIVPAGSVVITHYDIVHRGTRQQPGISARRFMYKFFYLRTREPRVPTWRNSRAAPDLTGVLPANEAVITRVWSWLRGEPAGGVSPVDVTTLADALRSPLEETRRAAGHALGNAGAAAVDALVAAMSDPAVTVRRMAAFALGETRCAMQSGIAVLMAGLVDADELVRSNSAFSLGSLARVRALPSAAIDALLDRMDPQREPDNTNSANMARSTVRECVVQALLQVASNGQLDETQRARLVAAGLNDPDRYVRGLTIAAIRVDPNAAIPDWLGEVLAYLDAGQYHPRA